MPVAADFRPGELVSNNCEDEMYASVVTSAVLDLAVLKIANGFQSFVYT